MGKIVEIITDHYSTNIATDIAIRSYEIPYEWPVAVVEEIKGIEQQEVNISSSRRDLTSSSICNDRWRGCKRFR